MNKIFEIIQVRRIIVYFFLLVFLMGCQKSPFEEGFDPYGRPDWLEGKVYTQIESEEALSLFAKCMQLSGMDTIVNKSGVYTVFAPVNEAINQWLTENQYASVEDIPITTLNRLVNYHIIQNPWSKRQLRSVDIYGWIDTLDLSNDKPRGNKRETLLKEENRVFNLSSNDGNLIIVNNESTNLKRKVIVDSRKYAPLFYSEYLDIYDIGSDDYEFYFGRPFSGGDNLHYANGKIVSNEIKAENGFVYHIDQVVNPLRNAYEILEDTEGDNQFTYYLDLVNEFPEFQYNEEETNDQPGAELGLSVDSLFDLNYSVLAFDINNERTSTSAGNFGLPQNVTTRYHHGLLAPTNEALDKFISEYIELANGWKSIDNTPLSIKRIIVNTHMSYNVPYPKDMNEGFYNGENDFISLDQTDIIKKEFGSNCSFVGLNSAIVPRAFSSVTGPIYLQPGFSVAMAAIERSGLLPALKKPNKDYMLFVESDANLALDSSILYKPNLIRESQHFSLYPQSELKPKVSYLETKDLRTLLLSHVAVNQPNGIATKEFIPNLAGDFIVINNKTGEVSGTAETTFGYQGTIQEKNYPVQISEDADNGTTYEIDNWFSFSSRNLFNYVRASNPKFYNLLNRVGLTREAWSDFRFISKNDYYTLFIPTDEAINNSHIDTLSNDELKKVLMLHVIQGEIIFTDGNKLPGYYQTLRVDEQSDQYVTFYNELYLEPGYDIIGIKHKDGTNYVEVYESVQSNILTGFNLNLGNQLLFPNIFNNAVVHEIDKVLLFDEVDVNQ